MAVEGCEFSPSRRARSIAGRCRVSGIIVGSDGGFLIRHCGVGSGVPGLATALGFAQQGHSVALIGPRPKPHAPTRSAPFDPRIYAVAPASVALLEGLGVWTSVDQQRICAVEHMRVFGDGGPELSFDAYGATVERLATIVEEGELCECSMRHAVFSRRLSGFCPRSLHSVRGLMRSMSLLKALRLRKAVGRR